MARSVLAATALSIVSATLATSLATAGTLTLSYPAQFPGTPNPQTKNLGHFYGCQGHKVVSKNGTVYEYPRDFELTFNATTITLTWRAATTLPAGTEIKVELREAANSIRWDGKYNNAIANVSGAEDNAPGIFVVNLSAPVAKSTTAVAAAQARGAAGNMTINGVNAVNGVAYMDVPRAVDIVSAGAGDTTQTATVYGTDGYGNAMAETIAFNGTTRVLGKKAFATITRVAVSAATAGNISVGNVDILGLPVFLPASGLIIKELQNGAAPTAGTVAAGATVTPTATTADVRGTYLPNAACDGTKALQLVVQLNELSTGGAQFSG